MPQISIEKAFCNSLHAFDRNARQAELGENALSEKQGRFNFVD